MHVRIKNGLIKRVAVAAAIMLVSLTGFASPPDTVVINEVLHDPTGTDKGCFVELVGTPGLSLDDCLLVGVNGDGGGQYNEIDLSGHEIPSDGYFVVAQDDSVPDADVIDSKANFQNGPDNIELWQKNKLVDSVGYGDFSDAIFTGEGEPTFDLPGYSIGRRPDGADTDNNSIDFVGLPVASPGAPNGPGAAVARSGRSISAWGRIKVSGQ